MTGADRPGPSGPLDVVGAVIVDGDLVLCARRPPGGPLAGLWEFPGGKVEPGESRSDALRREVREELGCEVEVGDQVESTPHSTPTLRLILTTFYCSIVSGAPVPAEHAELRWVTRSRLSALDWAPADVPAVRRVAGD